MNVGRIALVLLALAAAGAAARAERLPVRVYTIADGLPHDTVRRIVPDAHGFLWICTDEGLARFDGLHMTAFGPADGLPGTNVSDLLPASDGTYWVATAQGLAVYDPRADHERPFEPVPLPNDRPGATRAYRLWEAPDGSLWCATADGLVIVRREGARFVVRAAPFVPAGEPGRPFVVRRFAPDGNAVWLATRHHGLLRVEDMRVVARYTTADGLPSDDVRDVVRGPHGVLWVATIAGLCEFEDTPRAGHAVRHCYGVDDGLAMRDTLALLATPLHPLVVLSLHGVARWRGDVAPGRTQFERLTAGQGLIGDTFGAVAEDRDGNVWLGSTSEGLLRISNAGLTAYGAQDGLRVPHVQALTRDVDGHVAVVTDVDDRELVVHRFEDGRFVPARVALPRAVDYLGWGWDRTVARDAAGTWWVATGRGLLRFDGARRVDDLAGRARATLYTTADGLAGDSVFRVHADRAGDVWLAIDQPQPSLPHLVRRDRRTGRFEPFNGPPLATALPSAFEEDEAGGLWIGFTDGTLVRRANGVFRAFGAADGFPERAGEIALTRDARGRIWFGTAEQGAGCIEDPAAEHPRIRRFGPAEGLASVSVGCACEDRFGRIYLGTGRGVDRLDPTTGRVHHLTSADGLPGNLVLSCRADADGALWFSTYVGVARLVPEPEARPTPPEVLLDDVRVGGVPLRLPPVGRKELAGLELASDQRGLEIGFLALDYGPGEVLRFRYRLLGSADESWSTPAPPRSVRFANLAPGRYRFEVLAIDADGAESLRPAIVTFEIHPPFWRTRWFLASAALLAIAAGWSAHRLRLRRLLAIERIRARIAGELHDDIGSSLSQIAILSDVARQEAAPGDRLLAIATLAREAVDELGDVVWAMNPRRDRFDELVRRVRAFGEEACAARGITFRFRSPEPQASPLDADARRQLFLLAKEALHNALRHAAPHSIELTLEVTDGRLLFACRDDGCGFDVSAPRDGNGLDSMERRAAALGARLEVDSAPGRGTSIVLQVPLRRGRYRNA